MSNKTYYIACLLLSLSACILKDFERELVITTGIVHDIRGRSALIQGALADLPDGITIEEYGHCWAEQAAPTLDDDHQTYLNPGQKLNFSTKITGLKLNTTYYVRAFARWNGQIAYGKTVQFTTLAFSEEADLALPGISDLRGTRATITAHVIAPGTLPIVGYGHCYATHEHPTLTDSRTVYTQSSLPEQFTDTLKNLTPSTLYYLRAYVISTRDTIYSLQLAFNTTNGINDHVSGTWVQYFNCPDDVQGYVFTIENRGYFLGSAHFWEFDPLQSPANQWKIMGDRGSVPIPDILITYVSSPFHSHFSLDGKAYIGSLYDEIGNFNYFFEYNPISNQWSTINIFNTITSKMITHNNKAYGHYIDYDTTGHEIIADGLMIFDGTTWLKKPLNNIPDYENERLRATFSLGEHIYFEKVIQRHLGLPETLPFWRYTPATDQWIRLNDQVELVRDEFSAFSVNGKGYKGFGYIRDYAQDLWEYNPSSDTWVLKIMAPSYSVFSTFSIGHKAFIISDTGKFYEFIP